MFLLLPTFQEHTSRGIWFILQPLGRTKTMCAPVENPKMQSVSYLNLLREHVNFRWFIASYIVTHGGA